MARSPMTAPQLLSILVILGGTGYALATMAVLAFPFVSLWAAWPVGVVLTFRLVKEAAG